MMSIQVAKVLLLVFLSTLLGVLVWHAIVVHQVTLADWFAIAFALVGGDYLISSIPWLNQESDRPRHLVVLAMYLCSIPAAWGMTLAEVDRFPQGVLWVVVLGVSASSVVMFSTMMYIRWCIESFKNQTPVE